jgi:hypothetical protein
VQPNFDKQEGNEQAKNAPAYRMASLNVAFCLWHESGRTISLLLVGFLILKAVLLIELSLWHFIQVLLMGERSKATRESGFLT